ncbi:MAG: DUF86 domain-containing protein [Candidatus Amulumruptor caecigallinarius]|nr:DUF86 domain-containing protein [Candidatus Amulumruptor caecigallinarius]MCM1397413.1 DUF86 domain-containing protein [Candidatus Amulumruptor caecigallinarius]MCM1454498.1 DUF86 domain-containing protein [bacterium]
MDERVYKYLEDILDAVDEINQTLRLRGRDFNDFSHDFVFRKFVERNIEIMGEAMNRILKIEPDVNITAARKIVDTRNYVIHAYDSLRPEILWAIVINHIPKLEAEVRKLLPK